MNVFYLKVTTLLKQNTKIRPTQTQFAHTIYMHPYEHRQVAQLQCRDVMQTWRGYSVSVIGQEEQPVHTLWVYFTTWQYFLMKISEKSKTKLKLNRRHHEKSRTKRMWQFFLWLGLTYFDARTRSPTKIEVYTIPPVDAKVEITELNWDSIYWFWLNYLQGMMVGENTPS